MENCYDNQPWLKHYGPGVRQTAPDLSSRSLTAFLNQTTKTYASSKAFTLCLPNGLGGTLTFKELETASDALATYLRKVLNLVPGDRVAIQLPNCLAYPVITLGIFKAGCVVVNVNPLYTCEEMQHQLTDSGAKVLFLIDLFGDKAEKIKINTCVSVSLGDMCFIKWVIQLKLKMLKQIPCSKGFHATFAAAMKLGAKKVRKTDLKQWADAQGLEDSAVLQYTGGTTGVSKGADLSQANILSNMMQILEVLKPVAGNSQQVVLTALPLYHVFAFTTNQLALFSTGGHNVLIPSPRPLSNLKKAFEKFDFTIITGVNTLFNGMLQEKWFQQNPPRKMRVAVSGGMSLQSVVAKRWVELVGSPILEGYGLTETSPVLSMQPLGGVNKTDSVGVPVCGTHIRIVDDQGNMVAQGERGELIAKGPQVTKGYWNRPDETAKCFVDGWFYTGDIAVMDADGYFSIVDRKKNMILVSGFNVYPTEVEDVIMRMPNVKEVAIVGVPDNACGEIVKAFIVPESGVVTLEEVRNFCKEHITAYKIPKLIELRQELPKTPVGKILHKDLRKPA